MKHVHYDEVEAKDVDIPGAEKVRIRWLIGARDKAPNFYMRRFEVAAGGRTPKHAHEWEHEVYVVDGAGTVWTQKGEEPLTVGDVIYMPAGEEHFFAAPEDGTLAFLCLIPRDGK